MMVQKTETYLIDRAVDLIAQAQYVVAFTGAGISTESGIPDFRSPDSGLWENADPFQVASLYGFRQNPEAFYQWVRPLADITLQAQPNDAHKALATLEKIGKVKHTITQNIDMLHSRAGTTHLYELHGHLREATCISCFKVQDNQAILNQFLQDGQVPHCPHCNGVMKPNVILFGEQLPNQALQGAKDAARACDLMLIIGSSLEVAPASDLPIYAKRHGAKLIIVNLEATPADELAEVVIHARAAQTLAEIVRRLERV